MGTTERRERERLEIRDKILAAARELLVTEGFERMTMRRIAQAIEYTPTAIYHHFKDKDEVAIALCREDFARLLGALQQTPAPRDPLAAIRGLGMAYARFALEYPNHYRFMFMTPAKPEHEITPEEPGWQAFHVLRETVASAQKAGLLRPGSVDTLAQVVWACMHGVLALLITYRPDQFPVPPAKDLIEQVIETSLRGVLARPKPLEARKRSS